MWMWALDDHVPSGIHINTRWMARIGLHEPYNNWDIVCDALKGHRYGSIGLKKIHGASIVVGESCSFGFKRWISCGESNKVLAN